MDTPQSASTILSATHGRQRRLERDIDKVDLKMAKKYGMKQQAMHGRVKYTFRGVVFIYDPKTNKEVLPLSPPYGYRRIKNCTQSYEMAHSTKSGLPPKIKANQFYASIRKKTSPTCAEIAHLYVCSGIHS